MDRADLELRVYVTGRAAGQVEWQVVVVEPGGQTSWADGGVSSWAAGRPLVPSQLGRTVSMSLRSILRTAYELVLVSRDGA